MGDTSFNFYDFGNIDIADLSFENKAWITLKKLGLPSVISEEDLKKEFFGIFGRKASYLQINDAIGDCPFYVIEDNSYTIDNDIVCGKVSCGGSKSKLMDAYEIYDNGIRRI